jgi:hypothetical protein
MAVIPGALCERSEPGVGDAHAGGNEGLHEHHVVGGVGDVRSEAGASAILEQMGAAALAAGDPRGIAMVGQSSGTVVGEQVGRVAEQVDEPDVVVLGRRLVVAEDQGDVDVPGSQQLENLRGVGVDDVQLEARMIATGSRRRGRACSARR